ncbi:MAG: DUF1858 domain-containing protein [Candidatus Gracilibacteria bacterium]|nr:DUF1858 domain-containing protein [Candidatus Gracilibacteria bacterium]
MAEKTIKPGMIIGEIVGMFPEATDIMLSYGLHCVGCHVNMYETLEQGMMGHGFTQEQLGDMLEELNDCWDEVYGDKKSEPKEIHPDAEKMKATVTKKAAEKVITVAEGEKKAGWPLRIKAKKVGEKNRYAMDFEEKASEFDKLIEKKSGDQTVTILLDKREYEKLNGIKIDYVVTEKGEGFKITNPSQV